MADEHFPHRRRRTLAAATLLFAACSAERAPADGAMNDAHLARDFGLDSDVTDAQPDAVAAADQGSMPDSARADATLADDVPGSLDVVATVDSGGDAAGHDAAGGDTGGVPQTACSATAHIGDSLSAMTETALRDEYRRHGVTSLTWSAYGGRAVLQKVSSDPETGRTAATRIRASGFTGCWVVALGTNDTANVAAGAGYTRARAIDDMMTAIDPARLASVIWVNTFTTRTALTDFYANTNMRLWNEALAAARSRWPNLRVYDWATIAATGIAPFSDGIHHTHAGFAVRDRAITDQLATLFPR